MGMLGISTKVDTGPGLTKQSFRDEVNINKIIQRFDKTGMIEHVSGSVPFYGDVSEIVDYQDALETVRVAQDLFMAMSAEVRERFQNDPAKMIEFLNDESNLKEAIELGMVVKRPEIEPVKPHEPVVAPPVSG